jgi:hypothetical protein
LLAEVVLLTGGGGISGSDGSWAIGGKLTVGAGLGISGDAMIFSGGAGTKAYPQCGQNLVVILFSMPHSGQNLPLSACKRRVKGVPQLAQILAARRLLCPHWVQNLRELGIVWLLVFSYWLLASHCWFLLSKSAVQQFSRSAFGLGTEDLGLKLSPHLGAHAGTPLLATFNIALSRSAFGLGTYSGAHADTPLPILLTFTLRLSLSRSAFGLGTEDLGLIPAHTQIHRYPSF